ncbi:cytoplasmic tRNA 2-thiolation protein 2 [Clohesyomyces aquaticus]|uniref:Cytoplasmic tRNA 2-thiolation protein 2 n=1 Tax=Clohesyomyces aquaticus TaxID=1231657 RepID=A0A1Y2A3I7_9PLEO|nr:cytoplasmic tRNA 2-thiolation protein 2 [Clohesyomyces aquaticus]
MPAKDTSDAGEQPCRRCREASSVLVVRGEPLCRDCFVKYVHTKAIKRMETLRVRHSAPGQQRKVLLPLSFGVSSVVLLHVLDHHLKTQASKTGRTGFSIAALSVDDSMILKAPVSYLQLMARIQEQYPGHEYSSLPLHDVFRLLPADSSLFALTTDTNVSTDTPPEQRLAALLNSLPSATARADVISTLRTRLIVEHAKSLGCEGILWGDSTTKLAEKTLSETAKGRGFSLPWRTADGESPFGITFNYPLRDLLKKELVAFARLNEPPLSPLVLENSGASRQASMSSKDTTIDDLMKQYFESVEEKFPSIVANVVRTTSKLKANSIRETDLRCHLCSMPVSDGRFGIHGWGGDQQDGIAGAPVGDGENLCYGCTRSIPQSITAAKGRS